MRPIYITKQLATADDNGIAESQTPLAGGFLTLDGVFVVDGVAVLDTQRRVLFTFAADETGRTFIVTGTREGGIAQSEVVAGDVATATTVLDYATVTSIEIDAASAGAIEVGTNGVGATPPVPMDQYVPDFNVMIATILRSGAANWTVQYTFDDVFVKYAPHNTQAVGSPAGDPTEIVWWDHSEITGSSANDKGQLTGPVKAIRMLINSGEGEVELQIIQQGTQ